MTTEDVKQEEVKAEQGQEEELDPQQAEEIKTIYISKARYWVAVLWCENMIEDWQEQIEDLLQLPFAYCIHDKCVDSMGKPRKAHVHLIIAFSNTTTYKHALNIFRLLGKDACNTCEAVRSLRNQYEYLIHNTTAAKKAEKYQYDPSERITGNNFDIGLMEQLSTAEKQEKLQELIYFIQANGYMTINDFTFEALKFFHNDSSYWQVIVGYNGTLERYCRGNYLKKKNLGGLNNGAEQASTTNPPEIHQEICCPECGSVEYLRNGKTAGGKAKFKCKDCSTNWVE